MEPKQIKNKIVDIDQELKQLESHEAEVAEAAAIKQVHSRVADLKVEKQALERQLTKAEKHREEQTKVRARLGEIEKEAIEKQEIMAELIMSLLRNFVSLRKLQIEGNEITGPLHMPSLDCFNILGDERLTALFNREFHVLPLAVWKSMEQAWFEVRQEYYSPKRT